MVDSDGVASFPGIESGECSSCKYDSKVLCLKWVSEFEQNN